MGLVDGDGYIEMGPQKQYNKSGGTPKSTIRARLVIRLHSRDVSLLTYLTKVLGVGSISNLDSVNQTRLIFSKKDLTVVIIPLIKLQGTAGQGPGTDVERVHPVRWERLRVPGPGAAALRRLPVVGRATHGPARRTRPGRGRPNPPLTASGNWQLCP